MDRDDLRESIITAEQARHMAAWLREYVEPLKHPEVYAALTHLYEAALEVEEALPTLYAETPAAGA